MNRDEFGYEMRAWGRIYRAYYANLRIVREALQPPFPPPPVRKKLDGTVVHPTLFHKDRETGHAPPSTVEVKEASLVGLPYELFHKIFRHDFKTAALLRSANFAIRETKSDRRQWAFEWRCRNRWRAIQLKKFELQRAYDELVRALHFVDDAACREAFEHYNPLIEYCFFSLFVVLASRVAAG
jgi:hypothetical protein